jgi:hypothetical protein
MEKAFYDVFVWNEYQGGWNYRKTVQAYSAKQAGAFLAHKLGLSTREVSARPATPENEQAASSQLGQAPLNNLSSR